MSPSVKPDLPLVSGLPGLSSLSPRDSSSRSTATAVRLFGGIVGESCGEAGGELSGERERKVFLNVNRRRPGWVICVGNELVRDMGAGVPEARGGRRYESGSDERCGVECEVRIGGRDGLGFRDEAVVLVDEVEVEVVGKKDDEEGEGGGEVSARLLLRRFAHALALSDERPLTAGPASSSATSEELSETPRFGLRLKNPLAVALPFCAAAGLVAASSTVSTSLGPSDSDSWSAVMLSMSSSSSSSDSVTFARSCGVIVVSLSVCGGLLSGARFRRANPSHPRGSSTTGGTLSFLCALSRGRGRVREIGRAHV